LCVWWRIFPFRDFIRIGTHHEERMKERGGVIVVLGVGAYAYTVGLHPLMSIYKYQHNHYSYFSSWKMSKNSLREGGWHIIGILEDGPNDLKEPKGMLSGNNPTNDIFRLDQGTHRPHVAFLTRAELYSRLVRAPCPVSTCDVSSHLSCMKGSANFLHNRVMILLCICPTESWFLVQKIHTPFMQLKHNIVILFGEE